MPNREATSRQFNRNPGEIKRLAADGPVVVTDHGRPSFVVMTWANYIERVGPSEPITTALADPAAAAVDLEVARDRAPHAGVEL